MSSLEKQKNNNALQPMGKYTARGQITLYNASAEKTEAKIDLSALDQNKYYPVCVYLGSSPAHKYIRYVVRIRRELNGSVAHGEHRSGYTLIYEWHVSPSGWGTAPIDRQVNRFVLSYARAGEAVASQPAQYRPNSTEYLYLRGGSIFSVEVEGRTDVLVQAHPEGVTLGMDREEGYRQELTPLDSIADRLPVTELDATANNAYARAKIEIEKTNTALSTARNATSRAQAVADEAKRRAEDTYTRAQADGIVTEAERRAIAEAEAKAQAARDHAEALDGETRRMLEERAGVLLASVAKMQGDLQRQIDGQTVSWFGEEIPTGRLWEDEDDKHEGDTYTVVAPKGVVITPSNQEQYPHVGKSFRWDGDGWLPIADTDVSRALALASEAQASADGKVTHYIGDTIPVGYRKGDLWTLSAPWRSYKEGSVLTAQADEIAGQVNFNHWREQVRYTDDSKVDNLKIGGRNYARRWPLPQRQHGAYVTVELTETLPAGEYTFSVKVTPLNQEVKLFFLPRMKEEGTYKSVTSTPRAVITSVPTEGIYTFTASVGAPFNSINVYPNNGWQQAGVGGFFELHWLKVEAGGKATDYTLSPEDVADNATIDKLVRDMPITEAMRNAMRGEGDILLSGQLPAGSERNMLTTRLSNEAGVYTNLKRELEKMSLGTSRNITLATSLYANWSSAYKLLQDAIAGAYKAISSATNSEVAATKSALSQAQRLAEGAKATAEQSVTEARANDGKIDDVEARGIAKTIESYRKSLLTEWDTAYKMYAQLYSNSYLDTSGKGALKKAYDTAIARYSALALRINTILSDGRVTEGELTPYESDYNAYRTALLALLEAIDTAEKAVQGEILKRSQQFTAEEISKALPVTKTEVDFTALNQNKYYPVCVYLEQNSTRSLRYRIRVRRVLGAAYGTIDFASHSSKSFVMAYEWEVAPSGWGASPIDRRVHIFSTSFIKEGEHVASQPDQYMAQSIEYVYLRGGSRYLVEVEGKIDLRIEGYPEGVTLGKELTERYHTPLLPLDSIAGRLPVTDLDKTAIEAYDKAKEEIDRQVKVATGRADEARRIAEAAVTEAQADGKISEAEARAIANDYEVYRQHAISEWEKLLASYSHTYGNSYLSGTPKTELSSAHTSAKNAYNALMSRLASTLSDSKVVASEIAPLVTAIDGYKTATTALRAALEVADKEIQKELLKRAAQDAQDKADAVQVGSRNLVLNSGVLIDKTAYNVGQYTMAESWQVGETYSVSIWAEVYGVPQGVGVDPTSPTPQIGVYPDAGNRPLGRAALPTGVAMADGAYKGVWTLTGTYSQFMAESPNRGDGTRLFLYLMGNRTNEVRCVIKKISIVRGNRPPLDWTAAPEDTTAEMKKQVQRALDGDYLRRVIKEGNTTIEGGLLATNLMALSPIGGEVTAYVNGDQNKGAAFAAGVTGFGTPNSKAVVEIHHSGHAHFGELFLEPDGVLSMRREDGQREYMSFGGELPPLERIISQSADQIALVRQSGDVRRFFSGRNNPSDNVGQRTTEEIITSGRQNATVGMSLRIQGRVMLSIHAPSSSSSGGGAIPIDSDIPDEVPIYSDGWIDVDISIYIGGNSRHLVRYSAQGIDTKTIDIDREWVASDEGEVRIVAHVSTWLSQSMQSSSVELSNFSLSGLKRHEDYNLIKFAPGGAVYLYGYNRYVYIAKNGPHVLSVGGSAKIDGDIEVTGEVKMSGSLARGEVNQSGRVLWCNGPRALPVGYTDGRGQILSDKTYKVYHNVGHTNYVVNIMAIGGDEPLIGNLIEKTSTYFRVMLRKSSDGHMSNNRRANAFTYSIEGNL